ncbi:MAG: anthranilate synthase component I family protein [Saprospiraceae bacterium]|nr:anthranilate synthase component I family protein [Saprospiraceae bacterium]
MMFFQTARLPYRDALSYYQQLRGVVPSCLFESVSAVDKSGRMSLIGLDPTLEFTGKDDHLYVRLLHPRGQVFFDYLQGMYTPFLEKETPQELVFYMPKMPFHGPESERLERQNIVQPLRSLLRHFHLNEKNFCGLYGALAYRFVYLFEDLKFEKPCEEPDFHLFLFDNVLLFNHLTQDLNLYVTRPEMRDAEQDLASLLQKFGVRSLEFGVRSLEFGGEEFGGEEFGGVEPLKVGAISSSPTDAEFKEQVARGVQLCNEGELLEIVLCRKLTAPVQGNLLSLYEHYRRVNPSPYLFYFDFGNETLLGASPELMLRYENGRATIRPISGSIRRSENPIEDHHLMMELLNSPKENSELDMLIDLGRNDLARICRPGINIDHYRIVEKYSHVTHTVAQLSGELEDRYTGFDALIASLNAGTLTGAPKIAAMEYIEQIETHSRGYYGGCIGWLLFNGEVNTAITIRTAHVRDGELSYCSGATILYESVPENEWKETNIKAGAFMQALSNVV